MCADTNQGVEVLRNINDNRSGLPAIQIEARVYLFCFSVLLISVAVVIIKSAFFTKRRRTKFAGAPRPNQAQSHHTWQVRFSVSRDAPDNQTQSSHYAFVCSGRNYDAKQCKQNRSKTYCIQQRRLDQPGHKQNNTKCDKEASKTGGLGRRSRFVDDAFFLQFLLVCPPLRTLGWSNSVC